MSTITHDPLAQRLEALDRANTVRMRRAALKRDIAAGRRAVEDVLSERPWWLESMWVVDLLTAAPRVGRGKAAEALRRADVSPRTRVGGLTDRQARVLCEALERRARH